MYGDDDLLALSGLQHLAFCERQWALIHIEGEWLDNSETVAGNIFHERVDAVGYHTRDGVTSHRRVRLYSHELGLYGIADIVETETSPDGSCSVVPVEYKVGRPKAGDWDRLQVAAQAMCLEEMWGTDVWQGAIFYGKTRRRETFSIDEGLRTMARDLAARMHDLQARGVTPRCESTSRCGRCSLRDACVPEVAGKSASVYWSEMGETVGA